MQDAHSTKPLQRYMTPSWTEISPRTSMTSLYEVKSAKITSQIFERPSQPPQTWAQTEPREMCLRREKRKAFGMHDHRKRYRDESSKD